MRITIDFSDIVDITQAGALEDGLGEDAQDIANAIYIDLTAPPPTGTPVDTGNARNGWQIDMSDPLHPEIYNTVPYINRLNAGSSQQSPAGFIDAIVDKHLR